MADISYDDLGEGFGNEDKPDPDQAMAPGRLKRLTNGAGAAVSVALMVGLAVWGYRIAVRDANGVPVVRAIEGPMRVAPEDPQGVQMAHQGLAVNSVAAVGEVAAPADRLMLAPRPVELSAGDKPGFEPIPASAIVPTLTSTIPIPGQLPDEGTSTFAFEGDADAIEAEPEGSTAQALPPVIARVPTVATAEPATAGATTEAAPAAADPVTPVATGKTDHADAAGAAPNAAPAALAPASAAAETAAPTPELVSSATAPKPSPPPASPLATPPLASESVLADAIAANAVPAEPVLAEPALAEPALSDAASVIKGTGLAVAASPRPAPRPAQRPATVTAINDALAEATGTAAPPAEVLQLASVNADSLAAGTRLVQLGAFDDEAAAIRDWDRLTGQFPDTFAGKSRVIQQAVSGGRTFFRLRAHGFADEDQARQFCAVLLNDQAACIPVLIR